MHLFQYYRAGASTLTDSLYMYINYPLDPLDLRISGTFMSYVLVAKFDD